MNKEISIYLKECGALFQKFLDKKHPLNDKEYKELLNKLNFNQDFALVFKDYINSLGLKIISSQRELILIPSDMKSPYYMGFSDYSIKFSRFKDDILNKKAILLMIHLGIIASFYPSENVIANEFDEPKSTTISEIAATLIAKANFIKEEFKGQNFADCVVNLILEMPHKNDNEESQRKIKNIAYLYEYIEIVLSQLVKEKFISKEDNELYFIKDKFKILIKYYLDDILINKFIKYKGDKNV